jgi:ATP-binding protein involved in chromosome partitioning
VELHRLSEKAPLKTYFDIAGDGGSDVLGQVGAAHRAVTEALAGVRHVVAVGSGKGGVGKSTLTMALAVALRHRGFELAILDADLNGPCQAELAGLPATPWVPGEAGLELPRGREGIGVVSLGSVLFPASPLRFESPARGDEHVWRGTREGTFLAQLLAGVAWGELDLLLVDLPPGAERLGHFAGLVSRSRFLLVTTPSELSRQVVARSLAALVERRAKVVGYLENLAGYACPGCGETQPVFPAPTTALAAHCLGGIPFDPALAAGDSPAPGSFTERALMRAADALIQALEDDTP